MAIDFLRVKRQIISLLNANATDANGFPLYSEALGDEGYLSGEIDTGIDYAAFAVMEAICSTDGHSLRSAFIRFAQCQNSMPLPIHYGTHGTPVITPFEFAGDKQKKQGVRKSVEEIASYRENPVVASMGNLYSEIDHDQPDGNGNGASPLSGFYAVVEGIFYFTGFSAVVPLAQILSIADKILIPDSKEAAIVHIAIGKLAKDGSISEKFSEHAQMGQMELNLIRTGESSAPSIKPTVGNRNTGTK